jgi:hypothetical protein
MAVRKSNVQREGEKQYLVSGKIKTQNPEQRSRNANPKPQTPNFKLQTPNSKLQTPNSKLPHPPFPVDLDP